MTLIDQKNDTVLNNNQSYNSFADIKYYSGFDCNETVLINLIRSKAAHENSCPDEIIDNNLVHKTKLENVILRDIIKISDFPCVFLSKLRIDNTNSFFFDHPKSHVPGMLLIESGRQIGTAISHKFFNIPFMTEFILNNMQISFFSLLDNNSPIYLFAVFTDQVYRKNHLYKTTCYGFFCQNNEIAAIQKGSWIMVNKQLAKRMHSMSFSRLKNNIN